MACQYCNCMLDAVQESYLKSRGAMKEDQLRAEWETVIQGGKRCKPFVKVSRSQPWILARANKMQRLLIGYCKNC